MTEDLKPNTFGCNISFEKVPNTQYNQPYTNILECFPNEFPDRPYAIKIDYEDFSFIQPSTNLHNLAVIEISYVPQKLCLETESLSSYLFAYKDHEDYLETIVNTIYQDICNRIDPLHLQVKAELDEREGIGLSIVVDSDYVNAMNNLIRNQQKENIEDDKPMANAEFLDKLLNGKE
jgi:7-cyano-7-deazaguanine reductase